MRGQTTLYILFVRLIFEKLEDSVTYTKVTKIGIERMNSKFDTLYATVCDI